MRTCLSKRVDGIWWACWVQAGLGTDGAFLHQGIIACTTRGWLAQCAWAQSLHTKISSCTACFAAERLCTVGPACAAGSWLPQRILAQDVFFRESSHAQPAVGWRSAPAVQELRSAILPPGLASPGLGQRHSFQQVVGWCVVVVVGGLIDWARADFVTGQLGHRPAWSKADFVTGRL